MGLKKIDSISRRGEVDALRGLAVLLMVFSHALRWAYGGDPAALIRLCGNITPGDLATPAFYLAAGLSLHFSLQRGLQKNPDPLDLRKRFTARLGKLFFIGVCMSLTWGVLQAQAITLLVLVWLTLSVPRLQDFQALRSLFPGIITLLICVHLLLSGLPLSPFWDRLLADQFPLFAILAINATGFYLASYLNLRTFTVAMIGLGLGLSAAALLLGEWGVAIQRNGASFSFLILGIGLSMLLLGIFRFGFMQRTIIFCCLMQMGRDALFLFVFHYAAFFLPLYLLGFTGKLSAPGALIFAGIMVLTVTLVARLRRGSSFMIYDLVDLIFLTMQSYLFLPLLQGLNIFRTHYSTCPRGMGLRRQQ
ncbi:MAG: heparan-alpha-glucosaminide N-acetyltransferase domain-containing protein [Bacillota bacterium]